MSDSNNWRWGQTSKNAFNFISQAFGLSPDTIASVKPGEVSKALKAAETSDTQVKMVQDYTNATKRRWKNSLKVGAMIHGLVRNGLTLMGQQRQQEAKTAQEYAKLITKTSVLSAKTNTAVQKTYLKGSKEIEKTGKDLQRYQGELNDQYQVVEANANTQSQEKRQSFRDRAQKRLAANNRPWRNY